MARPPKQGLDYFPKDMDFYHDYKIMDLLEKYGPVGTIIYDVILTEIYRKGYYLAEHGYPPSIREIADGVGVRYASTVYHHICIMLKRRWLETDAKLGTSRAIRVPGY